MGGLLRGKGDQDRGSWGGGEVGGPVIDPKASG